MATNGVSQKVSSVASSPDVSPASTEKASKKEKTGGTIKLKRPPPKQIKAGNWQQGEVVRDDKKKDGSPTSVPSPIVNEMDDKIVASFATGQPMVDEPDTVNCKHCKKAILKTVAIGHIKNCAKQKAEKLKKKKEAKEAAAKEKEAKEAKEKAKDGSADVEAKATANGKVGEDGDSPEKIKSAKKSAAPAESKAADDGQKKSKKRKADADAEKGPKPKKKKDEPKPKVAKPKGPVDVEKQCGVQLPNGAQCARSLTCKSHSMGAKRAVPGRSLPYDMLLSVYQKKNQAKQQKAAIDANAPLQDELDSNSGPVDSDEEKDAIMAAIVRSRPQPLEQRIFVPTRRKYQYIRMKGLISGALGGSRGGGLFSTGDSAARGFFSGGDMGVTGAYSSSPILNSSSDAAGSADSHTRRVSMIQQAASRTGGGGGGGGQTQAQRKASTSSLSAQT